MLQKFCSIMLISEIHIIKIAPKSNSRKDGKQSYGFYKVQIGTAKVSQFGHSKRSKNNTYILLTRLQTVL